MPGSSTDPRQPLRLASRWGAETQVAGDLPRGARPGARAAPPLSAPRGARGTRSRGRPLSCPLLSLLMRPLPPEEPTAGFAPGPRDPIAGSLCIRSPPFIPRPGTGKQIISTRLDELDSGPKWKRNPVFIIADKAGGRAACVALAAPRCTGGRGGGSEPQSKQGLSRGPPTRVGGTDPISPAAAGEG